MHYVQLCYDIEIEQYSMLQEATDAQNIIWRNPMSKGD